jgi:ABC-type ATPase involved in cell division
MHISIHAAHKSIPSGISFELPEFCVLTGINGSGKSHLLEVLADAEKCAIKDHGNALNNIIHVGFNGLNPQIAEQSDPSQITQSINNFWANIQGIASHYQLRVQSGEVADNDVAFEQFLKEQVQHKPTVFAVTRLLNTTGKRIGQIRPQDISSDLSFTQPMHGQLFTSHIALIFKAYHTRSLNNAFDEFRYKQHGESTEFLTKEEFENKFGPPPWELIDNILARAGLPYQVTSPKGADRDLPFHFKLIDPQRNIEISPNDLSSGEKVLLSLALAIYNTGVGGVKPDLLLLDEPDAALHPRFSKLLIEVLLETIVERARVNVIFTTHSPSTVAMSPDGSVFEITKTSKIPHLVSNAHAVESLTEGLTYLRISHEDRRQVFVESKYDVIYFERMFNLLSRRHRFNYRPAFLEPHSGSSNCTDVIAIVDKLRSNGSDLAYGIIDYDQGNRSGDAIFTLGGGTRYAIENYLLDPIYLALALIRHDKKTFSDFGVINKNNYLDSQSLSQAECQSIVDNVLQKIEIPLTELQATTYENGFTINYPTAFLLHQGHDYEKLILKIYPELNAVSKSRGDSGLKLGVLQVIEELPQYLPVEFANTLKNVLGVRR